VLDTCGTAAEAVDYFESVPHARNVNVLVADAASDVAAVEASPAAVTVRRPREGARVLVATNQFHTAEMREHQPLDRRPVDCSRARTVEAWADGREAPVGPAALRSLVGDADAGIAWPIGEGGDDPRSTIWSWVVDTGGDAWQAPESPVEAPYETVAWPAGGDA
jgi:hypothetical protein